MPKSLCHFHIIYTFTNVVAGRIIQPDGPWVEDTWIMGYLSTKKHGAYALDNAIFIITAARTYNLI